MRGTGLGLIVVFSIPFAATFACGRTEPAVPNLAPPQEVEIPKASASPSSSAPSLPTAVASAQPPKPEDVKEAPNDDEGGGIIGVLGSGGPSVWAAGALSSSTGLWPLGQGAGSGSSGYGAGPGSVGSLRSATPPSIRQGAVQVVGKLPPEVIQRIVRQNFGRFRLCYENGLRTNPALAGTVTIKLVIAKDGSTRQGNIASTDLPDKAVAACILRGFSNLSFPQPESGEVVVVYPLKLAPGTPPTPPGSAKPAAKPVPPPAPRASASQASP